MTLRAITVRQPWAWAIVHGQKDVENRTRNIAGGYRGPVAIHAGLSLDTPGLDDLNILVALLVDGIGKTASPAESRSARGAILGVVDLVDVHFNECDPWAVPPVPSCSDWAQHGQYHLALANPRPLPRPVPARGFLGLWTLPDDVEARVREQLETSNNTHTQPGRR